MDTKEGLKEESGVNTDNTGETAPKARIHCEVCNVYCPGEVAYQAHIVGAKHKKILRNTGYIVPLDWQRQACLQYYREFEKNQAQGNVSSGSSVLVPRLASVTSPVLGLDMVTEYQPKEGEKGGNLVYFCDLCRVRCDSSTIVSHLNGLKHRIAFLKQYQPEVVPEINKLEKKADQVAAAEKAAQDIEMQIGRKQPKVILSSDDDQNLQITANFHPVRPVIGQEGKVTVLGKIAADMTEPVIGLDRVTEIQPQDYVPGGSLRYYCSLCEAACDSSTIRTHIIGLRHRIAFLKEHKPQLAKEVEEVRKKSESSLLAEKHAQAIEAELGKKMPRLYVEPVSNKRKAESFSSSAPSAAKKPAYDNTYTRGRFTGNTYGTQNGRGQSFQGGTTFGREGGMGRGGPNARGTGRGKGPDRGAGFGQAGLNMGRGAGRGSQNAGRGAGFQSAGRGAGRGQGPSRGRGNYQNQGGSSFRQHGSEDTSHYEALLSQATSILESIPSTTLLGSMKNVLKKLDAEAFRTDEEASVALELSTRLTQCLLDFRKSTVPQHIFERAKQTSGLDDYAYPDQDYGGGYDDGYARNSTSMDTYSGGYSGSDFYSDAYNGGYDFGAPYNNHY